MIVPCYDLGNDSVLPELFEDNEEIFEDNQCPPLNNELVGEHNDLIPKVGMKFSDENEIYEFYKRYAYDVGFPVKKKEFKEE